MGGNLIKNHRACKLRFPHNKNQMTDLGNLWQVLSEDRVNSYQ